MDLPMANLLNQSSIRVFKKIRVHGTCKFVLFAPGEKNFRLQLLQRLMEEHANLVVMLHDGACVIVDNLFPIAAVHIVIKHPCAFVTLG